MCFDLDSSPPIAPIAGASVDTSDLVLEAADGNRLAAFRATPSNPVAGVVVLPDVRGLHHFYEELAVRLAEAGFDALAIDYFGRTAGVGKRGEDFPYQDHVAQTTFSGVRDDVASAAARLKEGQPGLAVFTLGFCFGGSNSWHQAANGLGLAGAIGFYGNPVRIRPEGSGSVIDRVPEMSSPILALMGGDDPSIPAEAVAAFEEALGQNRVPHDVVVYPGAPHSFFDRKYEEFAEESADAWRRVLDFLGTHS